MKHEHVANRVESISMASGILAGLAAAGAYFLEPTGLDAFGVWLGLEDEPWIMSIEPILAGIATATGTLSGFTFFWAQAHKRKQQGKSDTADDSNIN